MSLEHLSLESLGKLGGGAAGKIVNAALRRAVDDLDDRGDDGKVREVTIKVTLKQTDSGPLVHVQAATKWPAYATTGTRAEIKRQGGKSQLAFQGLAPDDPRQSTIDALDGREGAGKEE